MPEVITDNLDLWTSALLTRSTAGRGSNGKLEAYGIKKLRELILELAVRGKLVPQDTNDEPAGVLLERITQDKVPLLAEGRGYKTPTMPEITDEEAPFVIPSSWEWVRLGGLGPIFNGNSISERVKETKYTGNEGGLPFIATKDVGYGWQPLDCKNGVSIPEGEPNFKVAHQAAVLICCEGGSAGKKCGITDRDICFGNKLYALEPLAGVSSHFLLANYLTPTFFAQFAAKMTGIIGGISLANFNQLMVPLPPSNEQCRIVAKIDALMALCDQLEHEQALSIEAHQTLVETLLGTITRIASHQELADDWTRIANCFDTLFTTENSIDQLKQAVLQLAVMGKLVPQELREEAANALLQKISDQKEQLVREGKLKKQTPLPEIGDDEKMFELPAGWAWARLQDVIDVRDGTHDSPKDAFGPDTYPLVTSKNFVDGEIDFDSARRISATDHFEIAKRSAVEKFDILFSMIGGNLGNQVMVKDERQFSVKNVALFKYYSKALTSPFFVKKYMEHLAFDLQERAIGGAQPFVSLGFLRNLVVALPPIEEQHRIVTKVDELMALCDALKARLVDAQAIQLHLADAIVEQAVC